jgi:hypothetical protein
MVSLAKDNSLDVFQKEFMQNFNLSSDSMVAILSG